MDKFYESIVKNRHKIGVTFAILIVISILLIPKVNVNYDLSEYIPDTEMAKDGLNATEENFGMQSIIRVMVNNVTLEQAKQYKLQIEKVDGVDIVLWLDDSVDIYQPESFIDKDLLEQYYKDNSAIFDVTFDEYDYSDSTKQAINEIKSILPADTNMTGSALDMKAAQDKLSQELIVIMLMLVPLTLLILILTTNSWLSPVLFILVIGVSIILNMGSNVIFQSVSFITFTISAVLQFAVSMDYSVFMLHQFEKEAEGTSDYEKAMVRAVKGSMLPIMSSSLTTVAGFLALAVMRFGIGADIGFVFAKGIILSLACVIFLMPYLILTFYKWIKMTRHKSFMPEFGHFAFYVKKLGVPIIIVVLLITIPSYVAQKQNTFAYGTSAFSGGEGSELYESEQAIIKKFGRSNPVVLLIPNDGYITEKEIVNEIEDMDVVTRVLTLVNNVPEGIPYSFVDKALYNKFKSEKYTRFIIYLKTASESDLAFDTVYKIEDIAKKYYGDNYKITGAIPITMDMKNIVEVDYNHANLLSILAIFVILLFTFKSISIPIILIAVIEAGIFINMAMPYYTGKTLIFLGYLVVSCIQLGATIDYAILTTNNYLNERKKKVKKVAAIDAIGESVIQVITSGGILILAGYLVKGFSSVKAISEMGELIGRGAIISVVLIIFALPQILVIFDKWIVKEGKGIKKNVKKGVKAK